jgi:hypothetical protein
MKPKKKKRIAKLNAAEDYAWTYAFCDYADEGKTDLQSDKLAWRDLLLEFPRLRKYDGCR